jgi:hypothetical protein
MTNAAIDSTIQMHAARTSSNLLGSSKTQKAFCLLVLLVLRFIQKPLQE